MNFSLAHILALSSLIAFLPTAQANEPADQLPIEVFAKLPQFSNPQLSPDAQFIAYISPINGRRNLIIRPLDQAGKPEAIPPVEDTDISWFRWANNDRLLVSYRYSDSWDDNSYVRTALFSVHKSEPGYVNMAKEPKAYKRNPFARKPPQIRDKVVDFLSDDPDHVLLAIDSDYDARAEIRRVKVENGAFSNVTEGYDWINNWYVDKNHEYRLGFGGSPKGLRILYIDPDTNDHEEIQDTSWLEDNGVHLITFTDDPRIMYALEPNDRGLRRLITFNVQEGERAAILFEHPTVDVTGIAKDPETGDFVGVRYNDDLPRVKYFDAELAALQAQLNQLIPGGSNEIVSRNKTAGLYLIRHISDREETYYALDMQSQNLSRYTDAVPIPANHLVSTQKHAVPMRDGSFIEAYLTSPRGTQSENLPLIVMPHGGPYSRDDNRYNYFAQFLANRGYAVLRPNFRGSTGYGHYFEAAGYDQWGGLMQDDVTDATRWAIEAGIADAQRVCIVGGSYGGYAALMGAVKEPDLYACAASLNGVSDLVMQEDRLKDFFGRRDFAKKIGLKGHNTKDVSPYHQAARIKSPVMILHAEDDPVVPFVHGEKMYKALARFKKDVTFVPLRSADHFFDTEQSRRDMLAALEKFLTKHIGN
ncbi:prolyl oligopeptidase family serine peptidase [Kordiimonas sp.]|uniref:alpha/beta hydrolase family protein n=1 Tax=Kordiimonas sp. TaxID=1970157 RepID=UPI003B515938